MSIIYSPLLESRRVHMRRQRHFGQDDPLIHPQPYNPNHGHLAVIPYPLLQDKDSTYILFLPINPSQDFSPLNSSQPQGLGHIKLDKRQVLTAECKSLRKRVARQCTTDAEERPDERGVKDDSFIWSYDSQIRYLLGRLNLPALSEEAATVFTLLQRIHLELTARLEWLTTYRQFWRTSDARRRPLANVVGALTDDLVVAQNMFHAGIPVWLVRPLHCIPPDGQTGLRVDKWVDGDALYLKDGLPSRDTGLTLTLDENDPPHPDVFTGPARSTKRFVAMGKYIHHLATSHVYTTGEDDASTATKMALPPTASSAGPSRTEPSLATKRAQPYNKAKSSKPSSSPAERQKMSSSPAERNKFMDVVAPVMPRGLPTWMEASRQAGVGFNPQETPLPGVDNGYRPSGNCLWPQVTLKQGPFIEAPKVLIGPQGL
ncbi:hypothetical protein BDZ89DRAFT_1053975 [Hymenopellis radicata]|nr:hypothetical protein BDZ89DRAFT_1053975 [Hymenopellis radicata]